MISPLGILYPMNFQLKKNESKFSGSFSGLERLPKHTRGKTFNGPTNIQCKISNKQKNSKNIPWQILIQLIRQRLLVVKFIDDLAGALKEIRELQRWRRSIHFSKQLDTGPSRHTKVEANEHFPPKEQYLESVLKHSHFCEVPELPFRNP